MREKKKKGSSNVKEKQKLTRHIITNTYPIALLLIHTKANNNSSSINNTQPFREINHSICA